MSNVIKMADVILHVPHASRNIPPGERRDMVLNDAGLEAELLRMTDHYTDELFAPPDDRFVAVRYGYSRLVVDPERFADDGAEVMVSRGMGVIYTHTSRRDVLRAEPTPEKRSNMLDTYYWPHHRRLESVVAAALRDHGWALIVDGHSFPQHPSPYEFDQSSERPDICIGTDAYHTPGKLTDTLVRYFRAQGLSVEVDRPFSGSIVPQSSYHLDERVKSVMIEVNRGLYMNEATGERGPGFGSLAKSLSSILQSLAGRSHAVF